MVAEYEKSYIHAGKRRSRLHRENPDKSVLQAELERVEDEIQDVTKRTRDLSEDLGNRYAVFRSGRRQYSYSRDSIISMSQETDECIQRAYLLERRRRELLNILSGK